MLRFDYLVSQTPELAQFREIFEAELLPKLEGYERDYRKGTYLIWAAVGTALFAQASPLLGAYYLRSIDAVNQANVDLMTFFMALFFIPILTFFYLGNDRTKRAERAAKQLVTRKLGELLGVKQISAPKPSVLRPFKTMRLVPAYNGGEMAFGVKGVVKGVQYAVYEVELMAPKNEDNFVGLVGIFDFHKSFEGTTVVLGDSLLPQELRLPFDASRARMESPEFERRFDVFTNNQVASRALLTPAFLERLVKLDRRYNGTLRVCFTKGRLLFAANLDKRWSLRNTDKVLTNESYMARLIDTMTIGYQLTEALNLDAKTNA